MTDPQRFNPVHNDAMAADDEGAFVTWTEYTRLVESLATVEKERGLYRDAYEAFLVRPGHDRFHTCYAGDGWGRIRAAVEAIETAISPDAKEPKS